MPAPGIAPKTAFQPNGLKPPAALKLADLNLKAKMMMATIGIATFHQVIALLTLLNSRMARKLMAVKMASRTMVIPKPRPVTFFVTGL